MATAAKPRQRVTHRPLPNTIRDTSWSGVASRLWTAAMINGISRGPMVSYDTARKEMVQEVGIRGPRITNAEAVAIVMAWLAALPEGVKANDAFPWWHQVAAVAYGWDPERSDALDTSLEQSRKLYPSAMLSTFWISLPSMYLDDERIPNPELSLDGRFQDPVFQGQVRAALQQDGAKALFKMPLPAGCKSEDGSISVKPTCKRRMKTWPYLCDEWECKPVTVDIDPLKPVRQAGDLFVLVLLALGAWAMFDNKPRHRRRG